MRHLQRKDYLNIWMNAPKANTASTPGEKKTFVEINLEVGSLKPVMDLDRAL